MVRNNPNFPRATGITATFCAVIVVIASLPSLVGAQEPELEVEPERAAAEVAPVGVALGGMPALSPLPLAEEVLETVVVQPELELPTLPVPAIPRDAVDEEIAISGDQTFFNATLGGGSVSTVLGSINVFRIGEFPEFRISYDHRARDGFAFKDPGSGFFRQQNSLGTWVRLGVEDRLRFEGEILYDDERFGLQQKPKYYSAEGRDLTGEVSARYSWDPRFSTTLSLSMEDFTRVLTASNPDDDQDPPVEPQRERFYHVAPVLSSRIEWPRLTLEVELDYSGRFAGGVDLDSASTGGLALHVEGVPVDGLTLFGRGAARYRIDDRAYFPMELGLEYSFPERWSARMSGGYRAREQSYGDLWGAYPVYAIPDGDSDPVPIDEVFFLDGNISYEALPGFVGLNLGAGWFSHSDRLTVADYDADRAEYPVNTDSFVALDTRFGVDITPSDRLSTGIEWHSRWVDRDIGEVDNSIRLDLRSDWNRVIGEAEIRVPIDDATLVVPELGGSVRYGVAEDVELRLFFSDVIAPFLEDGRTRRGVSPSEEDPFIEPGFEVGASVRVSF